MSELRGLAPDLLRSALTQGGRLARAWLHWFWQLSVAGKIAATAVEIVALYLVSHRLPIAPAHQHETAATGSVLLALLLVVAVAFGSSRAN